MEYKYHPLIKYIIFFIIVYLFLRYQSMMKGEILLANTLVITVYYIILDHIFISNHENLISNSTDAYFDSDEINNIKDDLDSEDKKEKKRRKKEKKKQREFEKEPVNIKELQKQLDMADKRELQLIDYNHPSKITAQSENHKDYVDIYNSLDNYKSDNYNKYEENQYPEYMAYNE
jgi:hypothetical protein